MQANNLYEQTTELTRECIASCLGFAPEHASSPGFKIILREIRPFPSDEFTIGAALRAYLTYMLDKSNGVQ